MSIRVEISTVNTAELPNLSDEKSIELMRKLKNGCEKSRQEYMMANLRLVLSVIQRFYRGRDNIDDVFQVGCIGLIKSIDNFDMSLNVKFSTYAVPMIMGEIRRYLRDNSSLKVTRSIRDIAYKSLVAKDVIERSQSTEATLAQIATHIGHTELEVSNALDAISEPMSIFEPVYNQSGDTIMLVDQLKDKSSDQNTWVLESSLKDAIGNLSDKERNILFLRYYKGKTQVEVSEEIGISQAQVSRLEKCALKRLKTVI